MGMKRLCEKCFGVEFGPHSFKTGIPRILVPGCVLLFVAIFFIVAGILLCVLHAAFEVSRVTETYDNWFLIAGIIAVCLGFIVAVVGSVWCCHVKRHLEDEMDYYADTKLSRSASMRSNLSHVGLPSVSGGGGIPPPSIAHDYPPEIENRYPPQPEWNEPQPLSDEVYDPVTDSYVPRQSLGYHPAHTAFTHNQPEQPQQDAATKINNKISDGAKGLQNFVKRNIEYSKKGTSPRRNKVPYSERMQSYNDEIGEEIPMNDEPMDLADRYKPRHSHREQDFQNNHIQNEGYGYSNIPDPQNALPKPSVDQTHPVAPYNPRPLNQSLNSSTDSYPVEEGHTTLQYNPKDGQWYYYYKGRPVSQYTGDNPERDAHKGPIYKYVNGKPVLVQPLR